MTQKQRVIQILKDKGCIDNFYCLENKITLRLGAVIHVLQEEGWKFDDKRSGFIPGTKNWRYCLENPVPRYKWIDVDRDGVIYSKRVLISGDEIEKERHMVDEESRRRILQVDSGKR